MHNKDQSKTSSENRYEFRCWFNTATEIEPAQMLFNSWQEKQEESRTDVYILSQNDTGEIIKIRQYNRLEIKSLIETCANLELWQPVMSKPFPVSQEALQRVSTSLKIPQLDEKLFGDRPTALLEEIKSLLPGVIIQNAKKTRRTYTNGSCQSEITTIDFETQTLYSVCLEGPDIKDIQFWIDKLGFADQPNLNYGAAIRNLL